LSAFLDADSDGAWVFASGFFFSEEAGCDDGGTEGFLLMAGEYNGNGRQRLAGLNPHAE
jgi:hypothetical protein